MLALMLAKVLKGQKLTRQGMSGRKEIKSNGMAGPSEDERRDLGTKPVCPGKAALLC